MSIYADLHAHTTHSDGTLTIPDLPKAAKTSRISVLAITDHDSIHPELDKPLTHIENLTVIRGIELRVDVPQLGERVDLLGYGVTHTPELDAELDRLQADRETRAQRIIDGVESELNISLDIEGRSGMGRPHIARAIADHEGTACGYEQAFDDVIGRGCPAYVARKVTEFTDGVELLKEACAFVSLAHPFRYNNPDAAIELAANLDAIEGPYPYADGPTIADAESQIREFADQHELLVTGGTDAHDTDVGVAGLTNEQYGELGVILGLYQGIDDAKQGRTASKQDLDDALKF